MMTTRLIRLVVLVLILGVAVAVAPSARAGGGDGSPLHALSGYGGGHFHIAPTSTIPGTFSAEMTVNIHRSAPNTTFTIWRARDPGWDQNGVCDNTNYGLWNINYRNPGEPVQFTTSPGGSGALHFHYEAPFPDGERFNVRFQFRSLDGTTVLESDCLTITVK